jgi:membrane protease YdiL (CAAX protease family)
VLHLEYSWQVDTFIMIDGLMLGAAMLSTRSIFVPMILHILWNLYAAW